MHRMFPVLLILLTGPVFAQEVIDYDVSPPFNGQSIVRRCDPDPVEDCIRLVEPDLRDQKVLVIPVVTGEFSFDPDNNDLDPNDLAHLQNGFNAVDSYWQEASYDRISVDTTVLDRYYQLPGARADYVNPGYLQPAIESARITGPVDVPAGNLSLDLRISATTQTDVTIALPAGSYDAASLESALSSEIAAAVGDQLEVEAVDVGGNFDLYFRVPDRYVQAGTYVHVDRANSSPAILEALNLNRPAVDLSAPEPTFTSFNALFPADIAPAANRDFLVLVQSESGGTSQGRCSLDDPDGVYGDAQELADHCNADGSFTLSGFQMSATADGEILVTYDPTAGPFPLTPPFVSSLVEVQDNFGINHELTDVLGFDISTEVDGVVTLARSNTVAAGSRLLVGQAVAAYLIGELAKPATPTHPIPNLTIESANEPDIDDVVRTYIDEYRSIVPVFLDIDGSPRAVASVLGGFIPVGIRNGAYSYEIETRADYAVNFIQDGPTVYAHEFGHNVGFPDLYDNGGGNYHPQFLFPNDWDIMSAHGDFPHPGVWIKEYSARSYAGETGGDWLSADNANIATFENPEAGSQTEQYVLTPTERGSASYDASLTPVPGRTIAKAIRLPIGIEPEVSERHFLLLSNRRSGAQYSQALPGGGGVYVTDTVIDRPDFFGEPSTRNWVHPLTESVLADGNAEPVTSGPIDLTQSFPAYEGISINVAGTVPGPAPTDPPSYLVNVTRTQADLADLAIRVRENPPWDSPNIWIEHGNEPLSPTPLPGNGESVRWADNYDPNANGGDPLNYIRVQVANNGTVPVTGVQVRIKMNTPGGMGASGDWVSLPLSTPRTIIDGGSAIFDFPWNPSVNAHTCIKAEVFRWETALADSNPYNNSDQENVTNFYPTASSPWEPSVFAADISNSFDYPVEVSVAPASLPAGYSLSLDSTELVVPERSTVRVNGVINIDEDVIEPPEIPQGQGDIVLPRPQPIHLQALVHAGDTLVPVGGITYTVHPTIRFDLELDTYATATGDVVVAGRTVPAIGAERIPLEIQIRYPDGRFEWVTVTSEPGGAFETTFTPSGPGNLGIEVRYPEGERFKPLTLPERIVDPTEEGGPSVPGPAGPDYAGVFAGAFIADSQLGFGSGLDIGFRYGRRLRNRVAAELELGFVPTERMGNDGLLTRFQAHALYEPLANPIGKIRPFVLIGAGYGWYRSSTVNDSSDMLYLGVGARAAWRPNIDFRIDARAVRADFFLSGTTTSEEILLGLDISF